MAKPENGLGVATSPPSGVTGRGSPPATSCTKRLVLGPPRLPENRIRFPSGNHLNTSNVIPSARRVFGSPAPVGTSVSRPGSAEKAVHFLSGDRADSATNSVLSLTAEEPSLFRK